MRNSDGSPAHDAYVSALRLLNSRDYTANRLREKLSGKGYDEDACREAIECLQAEGWLNDLRFAERFAESARSAGRYFGLRLRQEMKRRGFAAEIIDRVLLLESETSNEDMEIRSVLEKRFSTFSYDSAQDRDKRRVFGYLQRKGFGVGAIMRVLKQEQYD